MHLIATLFGHPVTQEQVALFVQTYALPVVYGGISTYLMQVLKQSNLLPYANTVTGLVRDWLFRGMFGVICAVIDVLGMLLTHGHPTMALFGSLILTFTSGATAYHFLP